MLFLGGMCGVCLAGLSALVMPLSGPDQLALTVVVERKNQLLTSFLAILLGITVIVSIKNIFHYSEGAVAQELDSRGQCPGAAQVGHLAGLLQYRPAKRHDSRGIRHATGGVGHRGTRQHLAQAVGARATPGQEFSPHGHLAEKGVPGESGLGRSGSSRVPLAAASRSV